jgi:hypothetical protein
METRCAPEKIPLAKEYPVSSCRVSAGRLFAACFPNAVRVDFGRCAIVLLRRAAAAAFLMFFRAAADCLLVAM